MTTNTRLIYIGFLISCNMLMVEATGNCIAQAVLIVYTLQQIKQFRTQLQ